MKVYLSEKVADILSEVLGVYFSLIQDISYGFDWIDVAVGDETRLSGIPINKNCERLPSPEYRLDHGVYLKPGKFIRALQPQLSDNSISMAASDLQKYMTGASTDLSGNLKISNTPSEVYCMEHHCHGSIGGSCMMDKDPEFFELYDDSPDIKILYMTDDNGVLIARALLHTNVVVESDDNNIIKFMDRVYTNNDNLQGVFFNWAVAHGYYRKLYQSYDNRKELMSPGGCGLVYDLAINCPGSEYEKVPYMDTFRYYCSCSNVLRNTSSRCYEDSLFQTDGSSEDGYITVRQYDCQCASCDEEMWYDDGYTTTDGTVCENCYSEYYSTCKECDTRVRDGDINTITVDEQETNVCTDCRDNYDKCEHCEEYFTEGMVDFKETSHSDIAGICESCASEHEFCDDCDTAYPEGIDCPYCRSNWRVAGSRERIEKALANRLRNSPLAVKNSRDLCIFYEDEVYKVEFAGGYLRLWSTVGNPYSPYISFKLDLKGIEEVLNMIVEAKGRLYYVEEAVESVVTPEPCYKQTAGPIPVVTYFENIWTEAA